MYNKVELIRDTIRDLPGYVESDEALPFEHGPNPGRSAEHFINAVEKWRDSQRNRRN
jgi:hypothetical protein